MATAREGNPYEGGGLGAGGKFRKRPFRRTQTTPYDRPPAALRNPSTSRNYGWFSKLVDPAQRVITTGAHMLFSSVFRKRLPAPPPSSSSSPPSPLPSETEQEVRDNRQEAAAIATNDTSVKQQGAVGESGNQMNCSEGGGFTELEKLLKQKTFTRSEINHLTALLHSKTVDSPVTEEKKTEVARSDLILSCEQKEASPALKNGIENCLVSTPLVTSSVIDKDVASPAEVAKAYMGSRPSKVSPSKLNSQSLSLREDPYHIPQKSPVMSIVPRATSHDKLHENGFVTPRSQGRSAIYSMARTPYARVYPTSTTKAVRLPIEGGPSSSAQSALDHESLSGSKKTALKRRSSLLDNDIGSLGHMRRVRQKSNLITSRGLSASVSDSPLSIIRSGVRADPTQQPSYMMQKPLLLNEARHSDKKLSSENINDTIPGTTVPNISSKSSEMASKILQQLDKLVSPKEKSSELKMLTDKDNSPAKLSPSMLRGQALRSMETVDSSKFLDHMRNNNSDGLCQNLSADTKLISPKEKLEHDPFVTSVGFSMPRKEIVSSAQSVDSSIVKPVSQPPQKSRAFRMSAHEYLDLDDDAYPNGDVSSLSSEKQMTDSSNAAKKAVATETDTKEVPAASPVAFSLTSPKADGQTPNGTGDGSLVGEKGGLSTSTTTSSPPLTFKPDGATGAAAMESIFGSGKSTSLNGSVVAPPLFSFGSKVASSPSKESGKSGLLFNFGDKVVSSKESVADAPVFNFGGNKNFDMVQQMPMTCSSSVGAESAMKFGAGSDSKLGNSVSSTVTGVTESMPKAPASDNADAKTVVNSGLFAKSSEVAVSSAASASSLTPPTSIFSFGQSLNQNNGPPASETSFSTFSTSVSNNFTSQSMFNCSPLGSDSSSAATAASSSSMTTSIPPVTFASSTNSTSSTVAAMSQTPSFFKFGSSPSSTTDLPVSSSGKPDTGSGTLGSSAFGSTSAAAVGPAGNSIFGLSSSAMTTVNSQSQGSLFGSSTSLAGAHGSATSLFAASTKSQSIQLGSTSSPLFGLSGNTSFSSGSSVSPSSSATNVFSSGSSIGLSTSASPSTANTSSSNTGAASSLFGSSSWQTNKSPFSSSFNSSSGFSFGVSSGSVSSTSSSSVFGSSTASIASSASTPMFGSFTSVASSSTPMFGSSAVVASTTSTPLFGSSAASVSATTSTAMFSSSTASVSTTTSTPVFGSSAASVASTTSTPLFGSSTSGTPMFGSSLGASSSPIFSFSSSATTTSTQPVFGNPSPGFSFGSAANNDQMSMEDSMAEDPVQSSSPLTPATPAFVQQPAPPQPNFVFGAPSSSGTNPFQFGTQQNIPPQNPSPFQASGSLEFNGAGSFSLGTGGGDKSGRKFVKVSKNRTRKK
ncbi:nuclear pore complex protein NUP1 [Neltuma alba]|uniref:nuclear pore complex protein NUP1 n=1 Tax=Neltuma alba TaxID=207710 RepID=UPI0010A3EA8E|nr:nuclear pore complex protein NUP1 [Prosopis alba]